MRLLRFALLFVFSIVLNSVLPAQESVAEQKGTSSNAYLDIYRDQTWCSLPESSKEALVRRSQDSASAQKVQPERPTHEREGTAQRGLEQTLSVLERDQVSRDVLIKGKLRIRNRSGDFTTVPVTYEITRDGRERVLTAFGTGKSLFISDGQRMGMEINGRQMHLSPSFQEDHQILVLPQWSNLQHLSDKRFGVKAYGTVAGLNTYEILPPARRFALAESVVPRSGTCVGINPKTGVIDRLELGIRAENRLNRLHRQSIIYSDYKAVNGILVPMTQTRFLDGGVQDILTIDSVTFDNGFAASEFTWPSK